MNNNDIVKQWIEDHPELEEDFPDYDEGDDATEEDIQRFCDLWQASELRQQNRLN